MWRGLRDCQLLLLCSSPGSRAALERLYLYVGKSKKKFKGEGKM